MIDRTKTLTELEDLDWGPPNYTTHLVTECHKLRYKPLKDFTIEDLRIMIGQSFSLPFLIPLALDILESDPLAEGDYYPGDLFVSVIRSDLNYWIENSAECNRLINLLTAHESIIENFWEVSQVIEELKKLRIII